MAYLSTLDGPTVAAYWLVGVATLIALIAIVGAWGPKPKTLDELLAEDAAEGRLPDPPVIWSGGTTLPDRAAEYHGSDAWGR